VRENVGCGRGPQSGPGARVAPAEARVSVNRLLDRMANIRISEEMHGLAGERKYEYDPTFIMRGLSALHVEFDPLP
jgi:hypothetical protein